MLNYFLVTSILFNLFSGSKTNDIISEIKGKKYTFTFKRNTLKKSHITNSGNHTTSNGLVYRNDKNNYLENNELINIQHDSIFMWIDTDLKWVTLFNSRQLEASLSTLSLDPYDILYCSESFSVISKKIVQNDKVSTTYFFDSTIALKQITISYWSHKDSVNYFSASFIYSQKSNTVFDTLIYEKSKVALINVLPYKESDYLILKKDKIQLGERIYNYYLRNYLDASFQNKAAIQKL